jgi:2-keto-3-deoxy-6-phosphogluconate aldolase
LTVEHDGRRLHHMPVRRHGRNLDHRAAQSTLQQTQSTRGGVPVLKALAGPFPDVAFCPTGGITLQTAPEFLALPQVKVVGGSWLTPAPLLEAGDWAGITELARGASTLARA